MAVREAQAARQARRRACPLARVGQAGLRHGIEIIYHASFADEEALDMLEAQKDKHLRRARHRLADQHRSPTASASASPGSAMARNGLRARARDVRRDHEEDAPARHPRPARRRLRLCLDAARHQRQGPPVLRRVCSASRRWRRSWRRRNYGGEIMMQGNELGLIKEGYLADLLLVDGDPLANVASCRTRTAAGDHEGRQVPQGAGAALEPPRWSRPSHERSGDVWTRFWPAADRRAAWSCARLASDRPTPVRLTLLNGVTLAGLYFLVASGFTLVFGLMRNVNLAHGSLYLLGAYIGYEVATAPATGCSASPPASLAAALVGARHAGLRVPPHGGRRSAADAGHDRHLHRRRRPDAGGLDRRDLPVRIAGLARRRGQAADRHRCVERHAVFIDLSALPAGRARRRHRHRRRRCG